MMNPKRKFYRHYVFSTDAKLKNHQLDQLIANFQIPRQATRMPLSGRLRMPSTILEPFGTVVVKCYRRGGLMGRFNPWHYLVWGPTRSEREYYWLQRMRHLGIHAPTPVVAAHRGRMVCRCWLVTRKIAAAVSLAQLSIERPDMLERALSDCGRQIDILVENRILHPDLHPGNVLVGTNGKAWLIDFDKTSVYRGGRQRLVTSYRQRWQRAVCKHGLPVELEGLMITGR